MKKRAMRISPDDNTATALNDIEAGESISLVSKSGPVGEMSAKQAVPFGHKLAVVDIKKGERILKYGEVIGLATQQINKGDYVHTHNVASALLPGAKEAK
ncbi:MAG TPA: UxaA family hydrolase [Dehalococcoidia bacterium]|nr:UxaA family hydrolase [Dehalococcoidia bacterium]